MSDAQNIGSHGRTGQTSADSIASQGRIGGGVSIIIPPVAEPDVTVILGAPGLRKKPRKLIEEEVFVISYALHDDDEILID